MEKSYISIGNENVIRGLKKSDKIYFSNISSNGRFIYTNIKSKTPFELPTIVSFSSSKYINIEYNEMFEQFLSGIYSRIDPEYLDTVNEKYLLESILENYKEQGYVRCKIDLEKYNSSFFTFVEKDKSTGKIRTRNINNVDFHYDKINEGIYTLKLTGLWRKESNDGVNIQNGLSIKILSVLVSTITKVEEEDFETEILDKLREQSFKLIE